MQPVQFSLYFAVVATCSHRLPIFFFNVQVVCHVIDKQGSVCLLFHIEDYLQSLLQSASIGGFQAISGDINNNGDMNKCWWTNKAS